MRGVTCSITVWFLYWICEPPEVFAVQVEKLMMGVARVTSIFAVSLSSVTVRGAEIVLASASLLRKESTALTPSALRKPVAGVKPVSVLNPKPPPPIKEVSVVVTLDSGVEPVGRPLGVVVVGAVPGVG